MKNYAFALCALLATWSLNLSNAVANATFNPDEFAICLAQDLKGISNATGGLTSDGSKVHSNWLAIHKSEWDRARVLGENKCNLSLKSSKEMSTKYANPTDYGSEDIQAESSDFVTYSEGKMEQRYDQPISGDKSNGYQYQFDEHSFTQDKKTQEAYQSALQPNRKSGGYEFNTRATNVLLRKEFCSGKEIALEKWILSQTSSKPIDPAAIITEATKLNQGNVLMGALTAFQLIRNYENARDVKNYAFGADFKDQEKFFSHIAGGQESTKLFKGVLQSLQSRSIITGLFTANCQGGSRGKTGTATNWLYDKTLYSGTSRADVGWRAMNKTFDYAQKPDSIPKGTCDPSKYITL